MKFKARDFIENLEPRSIPLLEQWAMLQRGILAVYAEDRMSKRKPGMMKLEKFRLEAFEEDALGSEIDDTIYAVLIGSQVHSLARDVASAYSHIDFFEPSDEIAEMCREALDR